MASAVGPTESIEQAVRRFHAQNIDGLLALLHEDILIDAPKGEFRGHEEVRAWATQPQEGDMAMEIALDELRVLSETQIAVGARRIWSWRESGEVADESAFGILFTFKDGLIHRWRQRFGSIDEAAAAGEAGEP